MAKFIAQLVEGPCVSTLTPSRALPVANSVIEACRDEHALSMKHCT